MTITMGQLVSEIFDAYDRELQDAELAAVATQVRISELLVSNPQPARRQPRRRSK